MAIILYAVSCLLLLSHARTLPIQAAEVATAAGDVFPTMVNLSVDIRSIVAVDEAREEITIDMFVTQLWQDANAKACSSNAKERCLNAWTPDLFMPSLRKADVVTVPVSNSMLKRTNDQWVTLTNRYIVTFSCKMNFRWIPYDFQTCEIPIQTLSSTAQDVQLQWMPGGLNLAADVSVARFRLKGSNYSECTETDRRQMPRFQRNSSSCIKATLVLRRPVLFLFFETILPTFLLVSASWIGFWIDPSIAPARVSLATVLTLAGISLYSSSKQYIPPFSYFKFIEIWTVSCTVFISMTLLEYAVVNHLMKNASKREAESNSKPASAEQHCNLCMLRRKNAVALYEPPEANFGKDSKETKKKAKSKLKPHEKVDMYARYGFPFVYSMMMLTGAMTLQIIGAGQTEDISVYYGTS